jgi:hypothetical protein
MIPRFRGVDQTGPEEFDGPVPLDNQPRVPLAENSHVIEVARASSFGISISRRP